jgi:hypothetical protein
VWAVPFFLLVDTSQAWLLALALVIAQVGLSMMYGPQAAFFSKMFSARVPYSGSGLYQRSLAPSDHGDNTPNHQQGD